MTKNDAKIIGIERAKRIRMLREIRENGVLPVAYVCTKYGSDVFVEALLEGEVVMNDHALVSVTDRKGS